MSCITYIAIAFIAGGYIIPGSMYFVGIYKADQAAADEPWWVESFITALLGAIRWPLNTWNFYTPDSHD